MLLTYLPPSSFWQAVRAMAVLRFTLLSGSALNFPLLTSLPVNQHLAALLDLSTEAQANELL